MRFFLQFAIVVVLLTPMALQAQRFKTVDENDERLKDTSFDTLNIDNNDDYSTFAAFDTIVNGKRIFFNGENHRFRYSNSLLQLKMLKYLHEKAGVRYLMLEFGYGRGWMVDRYVNEEDTSLFETLRLYSYKEYADFYKNIREFNMTLPQEERIHVIGMDMERFTALPSKILSMLLPDSTHIPEEIALNIEGLKTLARYNDEYLKEKKEQLENEKETYKLFDGYSNYSARRTLGKIIENFDEMDSIYQNYLGANYEIFKTILQELKDYNSYDEYSRTPQMEIFRERYMFSKFKRFIKENPEAKIFGQFGRCHIAKDENEGSCPYRYFDAFATRLNNDSLFKESVLSFGIYYPKGLDFERITKKNIHIQRLAAKTMENRISVTRITEDTAVFGEMPKYFDFLIINNISLKDESKNLESNDDPYGGPYEDNSNFFLGYGFGYYFTNQNIAKVNNHLNDLGFKRFATPLNEYVFSGTSGNKGGFVSKLEVSYTPKTDVNNDLDTTIATFGGSNWMVKYGWDILETRWLHIEPFLGFGYSYYTLSIRPDQTKINPGTNIFGDPVVQKYINPAFVLDASLDAYIKIKAIGIGGTVGYRHDVSKQHWLSADKDLLPNSPEFSASALYYGITVSIVFQ